jgi:hypothetical protein
MSKYISTMFILLCLSISGCAGQDGGYSGQSDQPARESDDNGGGGGY